MKHRDVSLIKYGISKERYRELMYFCMQYQGWKDRIEYGLKAGCHDGQPHGGSVGNPTEEQAIKNAEYECKAKMIEDTAYETDQELWKYILNSVTMGIPYEYMKAPCGRRQFYDARRKFFYLLSKKR